MAAQVVRELNRQRDKDGLNYARKAMIRTGQSLDLDGVWREKQLFPHLQELINKHRDLYNSVLSDRNQTLFGDNGSAGMFVDTPV